MENNKLYQLNKLRAELTEVTKEYDRIYDEREKLRNQVSELELEVESDVVDQVRKLLETNKFLRLTDTEIIYISKFYKLSEWDERFYLDGDVIVFMKSDNKYFANSTSEMNIGNLSEIKLIKPMTKDEVSDAIRNSNITDLIKSLHDILNK